MKKKAATVNYVLKGGGGVKERGGQGRERESELDRDRL